MESEPKTIEYLNLILKNELTAINQYFLHSKIFKNWGYNSLAQKEYQESIDEMKHADQIMDRILFLEGLPNLQDLNHLQIGEDVPQALQGDLQMEFIAVKDLKDTIKYAESVEDYITRDLAKSILASEEEHIDWLETQLNLIKNLGVQNYLQSII